ncbi:helix-turn-helix transcriptional regulator [Frankia sp. R43]|uniref:helix-turn-helix transcriptional regulator n=1 Tax=Frankia sp. R43 TaxID=269536 RepID=UPI00128FAED6|nr:helix-turn-helix transcriptional regulator [Frankia sp. R43]
MGGTSRRRYCACGTRLAGDHRESHCAACLRRERDRDGIPPDVPLSFWQTDQLRDAFAAQHIGLVAVAYRTHRYHRRPISQERLGAWFGLTQAQISRIESGPPIRDLDRLVRWAAILKLPPELLWFDLPGQPRAAAPAADRLDIEATASANRWVSSGEEEEEERGRPASRQPDAESIRAATIAFRAADRQLGSGRLYPVVTRFLHTDVLSQLAGSVQPDPAAFSAAASLTDMAGWLAYDDDRPDQARRHFAQAFGLASAADDPALSAQVLVSQSHLALEHGRTAEAVRLAEAGLVLVPPGPACAPLRARLHAMSARGLALLRDEPACLRALHHAGVELAATAPAPSTWLSPFDEAALAAEAAIARRDLGHLEAGLREVAIVLRLRGMDRVRSRSFSQLTQASMHLRQGDLDAAATMGTTVLEHMPHLASQRVTRHLRSLGHTLHPHAGVPAVAAFHDQLAATLPAQRPATP